jgi:hypothetical protein
VLESIHVVTPDIHQRYAGRYNLVPNRLANGNPVWKQAGCGAERWLYTGRTGRLYLGGRKEENEDFQCSRGAIRSASLDNGSPDSVRNGWQCLSYGHWIADPAIKIGIVPPETHRVTLMVMLPGANHDCHGRYDCSGDWANGYPVWKQRVGVHWLYSGTDGRWYVGGSEKKVSLFQVAKEGTDGLTFLRSGTVHSGVPPERCGAAWEIAEAESPGVWHADRAVVVRVPENDDRISEAHERPYYEISEH